MKTVPFIVFLFVSSTFASVLDISSSTLNLVGADTTSSTYADAMSVNVNSGGHVMVIGTFSTAASTQSGTGFWRLNTGGTTSTEISRSLNPKRDKGIGSVVHVFSNMTAGSTINLQHRIASGNTLTTFGGNMIAIPLTVSTGELLNHGLHQQSSSFSTAATSFTATDIKTTVSLDRSSNNGMYLAASFNAQAVTSGDTGVWQMQYRKVGDLSWIDSGNEMKRTMSNTSDSGSVTMYALEEGLETGTYEVQVVARTEAGETIETLNGTLAAVSLSYTNATGGGYFDGFMVETNSLSLVGGADGGAVSVLSLMETNSGIFSSLSFDCSSSVNGGKTGGFDLLVTNTLAQSSNQQNERYFDGITDMGSGGSAGYYANLGSGDHTVIGRIEDGTSQVSISNVTMVGFATEAIPEPAVLTLIVFMGGGLIVAKRIFR